MRSVPSHASIVATAAVTATFSAVVGVILVTGYLARRPQLALDDPRYQSQRLLLEKDPADATQQEALHRIDVQLRRKYFRQQQFLRRGAVLFTGGIAATMLLAHWATTIRRRLPHPRTDALPQDGDLRSNRMAQWAVGSLTVLLLVVVSWRAAFTNTLADVTNVVPVPAKAVVDQLADAPIASQASATSTTASPGNDTAAAPQPIDLAKLRTSWPRFRGPQGDGTSAFPSAPTHWDGTTGEGICWKVPLALPGVSSPIVWEDRIFLTGATKDQREVYCFAASDGALLWQRSVGADVANGEDLKVSDHAGFAAPTPATDGRRVYAIFARGDLVAFDLEGNQLWYDKLGPFANAYGHASSLATFEDRLIIELDQGNGRDGASKLMARSSSQGDIAWEVARQTSASWTSPLVVQLNGQWQIITSADPGVIAYEASSGRELWRANCLKGELGPSPVYYEGMVYVANDGATLAAIDAGGKGDVTDTHVRWTADYSLPDISSPLATDRFVILVSSYGTLVGYDRVKGGEEPLWEVEIDGLCTASPSLVGDLVYLFAEDGKGSIFKLEDTGCERVAVNELGEPCSASPAFQQDRIYVRGEQHLFCIGARD